MVARASLLVVFFTFATWGQNSEHVFYFTNLDTPQAFQQVANMVRSVGDIRDVSVDTATRSLTVKGTADQIAAAGWLTAEMDKPGNATGSHEFTFNDPRAPLAQVAYVSHVEDPRDLQDIVNAMRSVLDVQRIFPMSQQKAIVMRALPSQVKAADWVLGVLDQPAVAPPGGVAAPNYRLPEEDWDARADLAVRVAALTFVDTLQAVQEVANLVRSMADISRCYPLVSRKFLVMRGNDDQVALAGWLLKQLDGPAGLGTNEFKMSGPGNQIAQVAHVNTGTAESLQETVSRIRTETNMSRVFAFPARSAVAMRGTADQLSQAQQAIQARNAK
jgi:hypothetical protein